MEIFAVETGKIPICCLELSWLHFFLVANRLGIRFSSVVSPDILFDSEIVGCLGKLSWFLGLICLRIFWIADQDRMLTIFLFANEVFLQQMHRPIEKSLIHFLFTFPFFHLSYIPYLRPIIFIFQQRPMVAKIMNRDLPVCYFGDILFGVVKGMIHYLFRNLGGVELVRFCWEIGLSFRHYIYYQVNSIYIRVTITRKHAFGCLFSCFFGDRSGWVFFTFFGCEEYQCWKRQKERRSLIVTWVSRTYWKWLPGQALFGVEEPTRN